MVEYVSIKSRRGKDCILSSPWQKGDIKIVEEETGEPVPFTHERDRVKFATIAGRSCLFRLKGTNITDAPRKGPRPLGSCESQTHTGPGNEWDF